MRSLTKGLLATLIIVSSLTLGACQEQKKSEVQVPKTNQIKNVVNQDENITPDDWVIVNDETFIPVVDKLGEHLSQARRDYLKGDNKAAAVAMREGAAFLKQELPKALKESQTALNKSIEDLQKNASLVENNQITSVTDLDQIFVQAYQADTEHLWAIIDDQEWIPIIEKPQQHWQTARKDFLNKDNRSAAIEVRKGIAFLDLEAHRTTDENIKSTLSNTIQNLEQLSKDIKEGKVTDVETLNRGFAKAQLAMGQFYESKARDSESKGELVTAGNEIIGAYSHIQGVNQWLGKDQSNLKQTQTDIVALRDSLGSPNEAQSRNLNKAIATINEQINSFNQMLSKS
jgi:predicted  nucleic acid-binding Zn-ribbon protein